MNVFKVPVVMRKETLGHIEVIAESMEKAKAVFLSQDELARIFNSHHVDDISFLINTQTNRRNKDE